MRLIAMVPAMIAVTTATPMDSSEIRVAMLLRPPWRSGPRPSGSLRGTSAGPAVGRPTLSCVAHAAHRPDRARGAELGPQLGDVHVDCAGAGDRGVAPHLTEQLLAGEHPAGLAHQVRQQV